jgi:hypothetical protein
VIVNSRAAIVLRNAPPDQATPNHPMNHFADGAAIDPAGLSPRLQRDDGIAIRKDWQPTRIHLEFLDRLTALAGKSR